MKPEKSTLLLAGIICCILACIIAQQIQLSRLRNAFCCLASHIATEPETEKPCNCKKESKEPASNS